MEVPDNMHKSMAMVTKDSKMARTRFKVHERVPKCTNKSNMDTYMSTYTSAIVSKTGKNRSNMDPNTSKRGTHGPLWHVWIPQGA